MTWKKEKAPKFQSGINNVLLLISASFKILFSSLFFPHFTCMPSDRTVYNTTPPRELDNRDLSRTKDRPCESSISMPRATIDTSNVADVST